MRFQSFVLNTDTSDEPHLDLTKTQLLFVYKMTIFHPPQQLWREQKTPAP